MNVLKRNSTGFHFDTWPSCCLSLVGEPHLASPIHKVTWRGTIFELPGHVGLNFHADFEGIVVELLCILAAKLHIRSG